MAPKQQQSINLFFTSSRNTAKKAVESESRKRDPSPVKNQTKRQKTENGILISSLIGKQKDGEAKASSQEDSKAESHSPKESSKDSVEPTTDPSEASDDGYQSDADKEKELLDASKLIKLTEDQKPSTPKKITAKIPYASLAEVFENVEKESSRLKITAIVSLFFLDILQNSTVDNLVRVVYLFINRLGPDYEPDLELGLGETLLIKAISEGYGRQSSQIKKDLQEYGDLGLVAQKSRSGQRTMFKPAPLEIERVFDNLTKIAKSTGKDSQSKKISIINKMLTACDSKSSEAKFLIRSLEGKLRIGLAEKTVLIALAQAFVKYENPKISAEKLAQAEDIIREAFCQVPNYEIVIRHAYTHGIFNVLDHCQLQPGVPLKPMLAKPTKSISEVLDRFQGEEFTCEYKYDGERAQVHLLSTGEVKIYSRNSEDMSQRYPDLISIIKDFLRENVNDTQTANPHSMILDCEAVAWDRNTNKILPFQVLSTRKRKGVEEKDITVHICLFAFDMLYFNDQPLITKSLKERRDLMFENLKPIEGKFQFATAKNSSNLDELQTFLDQSVKDSCEGLMVKMLNGGDSFYEPSKRSRNWLKLKKDYLAGVGDSLDLVVIGGYMGKGKRTGTYGGFLLASYNEDTGDYETTCKIGTGFSDEDLLSIYNKLKSTEISKPKSFYIHDTSSTNLPDVWFEPSMIFEVLTADLSLSPVYKAAHQVYGKGISLRFPRFIRIRDDKSIEDATSSTQVSEFYERQANLN